jgi:uncharacterized metal-binding protein YceD (DUF177 family)
MKLNVETIPEVGKVIDFSEETKWVKDLADQVIEGRTRSCVGKLVFTKFGTRVKVNGDVAIQAMRPCERCGDDFALDMSVEVRLQYIPAGQNDAMVESELAETDLDMGWYDDGCIAISDVLSEALALSMPERMICLDVEGCDIRTAALLASAREEAPSGHPGFAALKDL